MINPKPVSGESFDKLANVKKIIKPYSYETTEISIQTDEKLCHFITTSLSSTRKLLYNVSDLLFSLQLGENLLDVIQNLRHDVDILSDEIKIRHCTWKDIPEQFLIKIIKHDHSLVEKVVKLNTDVEMLFNGILTETKKHKRGRYYISREFWLNVDLSLGNIRGEIKNLAILFKEREAMCNIHPITLNRTFKKLQQEIRSEI